MDENERDTHFKNGFANLLVQEIDEQVGAVVQWGLEHDIDSQEKIGQELYSRWQTIIAQRAYDLAYHAITYTSNCYTSCYTSGYLDGMEEVDVTDIPDLTEWPEH